MLNQLYKNAPRDQSRNQPRQTRRRTLRPPASRSTSRWMHQFPQICAEYELPEFLRPTTRQNRTRPWTVLAELFVPLSDRAHVTLHRRIQGAHQTMRGTSCSACCAYCLSIERPGGGTSLYSNGIRQALTEMCEFTATETLSSRQHVCRTAPVGGKHVEVMAIRRETALCTGPPKPHHISSCVP